MTGLFILSSSAVKQNKALSAGQLRGTGATDAHLHLPLFRAQAARERSAEPLEAAPRLHLPAGVRESPQARDKIHISPSGGELSVLPQAQLCLLSAGFLYSPALLRGVGGSPGVWGAQTRILVESQTD